MHVRRERAHARRQKRLEERLTRGSQEAAPGRVFGEGEGGVPPENGGSAHLEQREVVCSILMV